MEYIFLVCLSWFFYTFEPLQITLDGFFMYSIRRTKGTLREGLNIVHGSLSCPQCVGFWLTLIVTESFETAVIVSLLSKVLDLCLNKLK